MKIFWPSSSLVGQQRPDGGEDDAKSDSGHWWDCGGLDRPDPSLSRQERDAPFAGLWDELVRPLAAGPPESARSDDR